MGIVTDEHELDWADFRAAVFHPLANDNEGLASSLSARSHDRLVSDMSLSERAYAEEWRPPRFEVGRTPAGRAVLAIDFGGGRSVIDWDGSDADAEAIVDSCAETAAVNNEWDYWVHGGGWKEWPGEASPPS
jgi:hypothetical protein